MSKIIKKIAEDIKALDVDDAVKELFTKSIDDLNEENKDELTKIKTKLNEAHSKELEGFAGEKAEYLKTIDGFKNADIPEPNKELLDRLKIMEDRAKASEELAATTEKKRVDSIKDSKLKDLFSDSIDAELLAERYKNRVKLVDGKLYTNDDEMTPMSELKETIKAEKPHLWKASGVGGSGSAGGGGQRSTGDYFSLDEINSMDESTMMANLDKVNKSAAHHAKK